MHIYFLNVLNSLRQSGLITSNESIASALGIKTDSVARAVSGDTRYFNKRFIYKFCLYYGIRQAYIETGQGEMFQSSSLDPDTVSSGSQALPIIDKLNLIVSILGDLRQQNAHLQEELHFMRSQVSYLETRFKSRDFNHASRAGENPPDYPRRKPTGKRYVDNLDNVLSETFVKNTPTLTPSPSPTLPSSSTPSTLDHSATYGDSDHPNHPSRPHPAIIPDDVQESAQIRNSDDFNLPPHLDLI